MTSRDRILGRLRAARQPFADVAPLAERRAMVPIEDTSPAGLQRRFTSEAEKLGCTVHSVESAAQGVRQILNLLGSDTAVLSWDLAHIPLPGLAAALDGAGIRRAVDDPSVRVGITGADAGLAGTGGLVLTTGEGKPRLVSLLPLVHIAVLQAGRIVPTFEAWVEGWRAAGLAFGAASTLMVVSGPSRTGDIANIPVRGVHGPGAVHVIIV